MIIRLDLRRGSAETLLAWILGWTGAVGDDKIRVWQQLGDYFCDYLRYVSMARNVLYLVFGAIFMAGCVNVEKTEHFHGKKELHEEHAKSEHTPEKLLRHVVLFRFKEDAKATDIKKVEEAFAAIPGKVDVIHDFEWGTDVSVENLANGFTHCFVVTFKSEADRDSYLPHPAHKAFVEMLGPILDKPFVVDYWTN